ncbi:MAG: hypothetical protein GYB39_09875 [Algicola sp.]|nr:hypothetical protein [Algicola sp.]
MGLKISKKSVLFIVVAVLGTGVLMFVWYKNTHAMAKVEAFQVNAPAQASKLLIATQGSTFKNAITAHVVAHYKQNAVFISVIDVSALPQIAAEDFEAILVVYAWEYQKPPTAVKTFLNRSAAFKNKMVILTTSGDGSSKMEGIDALTGESRLENSTTVSRLIIEKLAPLLN